MKTILLFVGVFILIGCNDSMYYKVCFYDVANLKKYDKIMLNGQEIGEVRDIVQDDECNNLATIWVGRHIKLTKGSKFTIKASQWRPTFVEIGPSDNSELMSTNEIHNGSLVYADRVFQITSNEQLDSLRRLPEYKLLDTILKVMQKVGPELRK